MVGQSKPRDLDKCRSVDIDLRPRHIPKTVTFIVVVHFVKVSRGDLSFGAQETPSQHQATVLLSQAFRFWLLGLRSHPGVHFSGGKMKQVCPRLMNPHPIIPQNRVVRSVV